MVFFLAIPLLSSGCESITAATPDASEEAEVVATPDMHAVADALAGDLQMDRNRVRDMLGEHGQRWGQPGFLWYVAVTMQQRMSQEEKERLFARARRLAERQRRERREKLVRFFRRPAQAYPVWRILTEEQRQQFREILASYREQVRDRLQQVRSGDLSREAFLEELRALREAFQAQIEGLLTDEQKQKLEERKQERRQRMEERRAAAREAMQNALQLTDEQMQQLETLRTEQREALKALRERFRSGEIDLETLKQELQSLRQQREERLQAILTPEQQEAMRIHRALSIIMKERLQARRNRHRRAHYRR